MSDSPAPSTETAPTRASTAGAGALNVVRGALIGTAETVPGVSGGTVALMTGVYEPILTSAGHFITGVRISVVDGIRGRGFSRATPEWARVRWGILIPLGIGMVVALLLMAGVMEGLVEDHPVTMRALFFGLVLASLAVPFRLAAQSAAGHRPAGRWRLTDWAIAVVGAVLAAIIVTLPGAALEPSPAVLIPAGAVAVSALVLPGLSGSFLLLTMGLYEPTLEAVNDRDLGYLAFFAIGLAIGLVSIVKLLQWLLEHHRRTTLVVLTGVMAGSLVALWPWQDEDRHLEAPSGDLTAPIIAFLAGFLVVAALLIVERRMLAAARTAEPQTNAPTAHSDGHTDGDAA
ncbi:DUF368 domain-containing protein [Demequina sp. B12]|uniref:DUF368 domain-containing protein n=1 Tax=Demequina sp. B12 TaxID=2992757 RepID=UPI00237A4CED|nr:DUF368 domain-containing protein [Demequina sp. B12]MDE0572875.1 DUF368 domain-containing protein [Demequina sp. B12]